MHFISKDFKIDKHFGSFDANIEVAGKSKQLVPLATTWQTTRPGPSIIIPFPSPEHTLSAWGSAFIALTDLSLLLPNSDSIEQDESTPLIAKNMDDTKGEAADIFNLVRKRRKRKILETDPSKTTQPAFGMLQMVLAIQSALPNTTPQVAPYGKITVPGLRLRVSLHSHKIGLILIEDVGEILNQYSSFIIYRCSFPCY